MSESPMKTILQLFRDTDLVDGHNVIVMDDLRQTNPEIFTPSGAMDYARFEREIRPKYPIQVRFDKGSISFTLGTGGCRIQSIIHAAVLILQRLHTWDPQAKYQSAITHLNNALSELGE